MNIENYKTKNYKKNDDLETLLTRLNDLLSLIPLENKNINDVTKYPIIFIVGTPRSGTTLLTQWLASLNSFIYPTNFVSRFHKLPYMGFLIQEMLFNKKYQYKNELNIDVSSSKYSSDVGKTSGVMEPHEFWYFWRNYFTFPEIPISNNEFLNNADFKGFENQISLVQNYFNKPFFLKALIINWYIELFNKHIHNAFFIYIKRNPIDNIKSLLSIREKYLGNEKLWFSFKPKEYELLKDKDPVTQVAGQVLFTNNEIENQLESVQNHRKMIIEYEYFCENPDLIYNELKRKLSKYNIQIPIHYNANKSFKPNSRIKSEELEIENAINAIRNMIV